MESSVVRQNVAPKFCKDQALEQKKVARYARRLVGKAARFPIETHIHFCSELNKPSYQVCQHILKGGRVRVACYIVCPSLTSSLSQEDWDALYLNLMWDIAYCKVKVLVKSL